MLTTWYVHGKGVVSQHVDLGVRTRLALRPIRAPSKLEVCSDLARVLPRAFIRVAFDPTRNAGAACGNFPRA
eukprot:3191715-Rhodomonas_salina.1